MFSLREQHLHRVCVHSFGQKNSFYFYPFVFILALAVAVASAEANRRHECNAAVKRERFSPQKRKNRAESPKWETQGVNCSFLPPPTANAPSAHILKPLLINYLWTQRARADRLCCSLNILCENISTRRLITSPEPH